MLYHRGLARYVYLPPADREGPVDPPESLPADPEQPALFPDATPPAAQGAAAPSAASEPLPATAEPAVTGR
jgi:hypothetical protein